MTIGIPKGLLYSKYHVFAKTFFEELGAQTVVSPDTNKQILKTGTKLCVDDACLPVKVFHGHAAWLRGRCDFLFVPRLISMEKRQLVCPMLCGLIDMLRYSVDNLPPLIDTPVVSLTQPSLVKWAKEAARIVTTDPQKIKSALEIAVHRQKSLPQAIPKAKPYTVALIGHSYVTQDAFVSMDLINKLDALGIGVVTADSVPARHIDGQVDQLFKKPFWYFARQFYGAATHLCLSGKVDGIIYASAFSCGVDSVVIELIKSAIGDFPFMVLKIDEHTGEAGFDTRLEAFADMLGRRPPVGHHVPAYGQYLFGS